MNRLRFSMESSETNLGYVFVPQAKNNRVVIVHQGHDCRMDDRNGDPAVRDGLYWTTRALVAEGYAVASLFQPHYDPEDCRTGDMHDSMWPGTVATGNPIKYFLEPTAEALNYLKAQGYEDFAMTGISGGGWTTMLYSAIDPRIRQSFPVAGSTPLYLRPPDYRAGDTEQVLPELYKIAGYLDLYLMAGAGAGRSSVQVYNRRDNCCFGQAQHLGTGPWSQPIREYEVRVRQALEAVGPGSFRVEIDEAANYHAISYHTAINVILAELEGNTRMVGAAEGTDAFVRGVNGNLWQRTAAQWVDTGLPMVGAPAVITGSQHPVDVFYRSPDSNLMHAYMSGDGWVSKAMGGSALLVDPVALSAGDGRWDVFTTSIDFRLYRWLWRPGWQSFSNQRLSETAKILGPPAAVSPALDQYQVFFRGWDQAVWEVYTDGASPWALRKVGSLNGQAHRVPGRRGDRSVRPGLRPILP